MDYTRTLVLAGAGVVSFVIYNSDTVQHWLFSPLKQLKGPESGNVIFGNFRDLLETGNPEKWEEQYGRTYAYHGPLGVCVEARPECRYLFLTNKISCTDSLTVF
jgi:hypothetical protein